MAEAVAKLRVVASNPSGIFPTEFKVVVKPVEVKEKTAGGIIVPEESRERMQYAAQEGVLVAVSPLAFSYEKWPEGYEPPQIGSRVLFAKYAGAKVKGRDGVDYRLINDRDVAAVLA